MAVNGISLYIPCRNADRFIAGCLEAVLAQSLPPSEILVVNDGSTDRTTEIAGTYSVRIIDLPSHMGLAAARNRAVEASRFAYVASLDADCIPEPRWLETLMRAMDEDSVSGAGGRLIEEHQATIADRWRAVHMRQNWGNERLVNPPFLFGCNTLFRKSALEEVGLYDPRFTSNGEDVDLSHRLRERGGILVYEPSALVRHLKRDTLLSVIKADWRWGYLTSGETVKFDSNANIVYHNFTNARYRARQDLAAGRYSLLGVDILLFLHHTYLDLGYARRRGLTMPRGGGLAARVGTLTDFESHLSRLSGSRFLKDPHTLSKK